MQQKQKSITILVAEDDPDDQLLVREALEDIRLCNRLDFVADGQELIDFLRAEGDYTERAGKSLPSILLLDLNMPRMDGREALKIIKTDPALRKLPVVVLTTSKAEEDIFRTYDLGVNSFITKPVSFLSLANMMAILTCYWLEFVSLPGDGN
jgi:CheY-like chemotaxis protein